jgi:LuxR family transcriptional regulator
MKSWQEDLLQLSQSSKSEIDIFNKIQLSSSALGFDHCAYGIRLPFPFSKPKTFLLNNYPKEWQKYYEGGNYIQIAPSVLHCRSTQEPLIWSDSIFASARPMWEEAQSHGLRIGWAQSSLDTRGVGGMLTLSRSSETLSKNELAEKEQKMRWLVNISHIALSKILSTRAHTSKHVELTTREVEVLKWTADGKSAQDIADILLLSKSTVDFHMKNSITKLGSTNKTAAVVQAAMMGLLN